MVVCTQTRSLTFYEGQRRIDDRKGAARMGLRKSSTFAEHLGIFDLRYEDVLYSKIADVSLQHTRDRVHRKVL
jgi:hypothetical protein